MTAAEPWFSTFLRGENILFRTDKCLTIKILYACMYVSVFLCVIGYCAEHEEKALQFPRPEKNWLWCWLWGILQKHRWASCKLNITNTNAEKRSNQAISQNVRLILLYCRYDPVWVFKFHFAVCIVNIFVILFPVPAEEFHGLHLWKNSKHRESSKCVDEIWKVTHSSYHSLRFYFSFWSSAQNTDNSLSHQLISNN